LIILALHEGKDSPAHHIILRGRYFDLTTLPDRPDFTSLIPPKRPTTHSVGLGSLAKKRNDPRDAHPRPSSPKESQESPKETQTSSDHTLAEGRDHKTLDSRHQSPHLASHVDSRRQGLSDVSNGVSKDDSQGMGGMEWTSVVKSDHESLKTQPTGMMVDDEQPEQIAIDDADGAGSGSLHGVPPMGENALGQGQGRQPSRSPGAVTRSQDDDRKSNQRVAISSFGEQASSPNSTVGHHSSNTPGVMAVSPNTSPENDFLDDELEAMETVQLEGRTEKQNRPLNNDESEEQEAESKGADQLMNLQQNSKRGNQPASEHISTSAIASEAHNRSSIAAIPGNDSTSRSVGPSDTINNINNTTLESSLKNPTSELLPSKSTRSDQSSRPSMRIDTTAGFKSSIGDATLSQTGGSAIERFVDSPLSIGNSATPKRAHAASNSAPSPPERMTTRVSSGAIRHKSVSEILGGPPKPTPTMVDKQGPEKASTESSRANSVAEASGQASGSDTPESGAIRLRHGDRREKERERSKLSTVVFAKPQGERTEGNEVALRDGHQPHNEEKDYLFSLFVSQAFGPPRCPPLRGLLSSAHKTLTTANTCLDLRDQQDAKIMKRIYQLQYSNRWPLRQQERSAEPPRPKSHWDYLLEEMKWMRTDVREERKWKFVAAKQCADWCAEFAASTPEQQALLQVKTRPHVPKEKEAHNGPADVKMADQLAEQSAAEDGDDQLQPTPDLVPSAAADTPDDSPVELPDQYADTIAPAAIFSLSSEEVVFEVRRTAATEKLLEELPLYQPFKAVPESDNLDSSLDADASWKKEIVPASRFVESKIRLEEHKPPKKKSRYDYELDDDDHLQPPSKILALTPEQTDVALFNPENKPIRDRIHPGHAFRPPSEFPMPSQNFFESRQSSQWTYAEDDELRKLVKEYSYNWSLISSCLSSKSLFSSGAERRTPWECFERWVSLEGLPSDMSKTAYFRAYHQRLETAQRNVMAQQQAAIQAQQGNIPIQPIRRRTTNPVRVDRKRSTKHLALLDGMRKLAKKRESTLVKQQQGQH
jgi:chromatin modification-related protein VID21